MESKTLEVSAADYIQALDELTNHTVEIFCPECGEKALCDIGRVLTSYPAQYSWSCPHCGKSGYFFCSELQGRRWRADINYVPINKMTAYFGIPCIICGETITVEEEPRDKIKDVQVCDACRNAILKLRKMLGD